MQITKKGTTIDNLYSAHYHVSNELKTFLKNGKDKEIHIIEYCFQEIQSKKGNCFNMIKRFVEFPP